MAKADSVGWSNTVVPDATAALYRPGSAAWTGPWWPGAMLTVTGAAAASSNNGIAGRCGCGAVSGPLSRCSRARSPVVCVGRTGFEAAVSDG